MIRALPLSLLAAGALASGCGSGAPSGDTWLASSDSDTLTLQEAAALWQAFGGAERGFFLDSDSAGIEFVRAAALRSLLEREVVDEGYPARPMTASFGRSWLRNEASKLYSELERARIIEGMDQPDIDFCIDHWDETVWLTASSEATGPVFFGQFPLPGIPHELAARLDSAGRPFDTEYEGLGFHLDSIWRDDPSAPGLDLLSDGTPDSVALWIVSESRIRFWRLTGQMQAVTQFGVTQNSSAVDRLTTYYAGAGGFVDGDTVIVSSLATLTSNDLVREIEFFRQVVGLPISPEQRPWVQAVIDNVLFQTNALSLLAEARPDLLDSLAAEAHDFILGLCIDSLREDSAVAGVVVTPEDLRFELDQMEEPPLIPERRVLRAVMMSPDLYPAYEQAVEEGTAGRFISSLPVIPAFAESESSRITVPLYESNLPPGHGGEVFALSPGDTTWVGPLLIDQARGSAFYRLVEILPEHPATVEDLGQELSRRAMARLEAEATDRWLRRLSAEHHLELNLDAIRSLPEDPGDWASIR